MKEGMKVFLIVCVYVNDLIYTNTEPLMVLELKQVMMEYEMSYFGLMKYFLSIQVHKSKGKIFISQEKYLTDLLKEF